MLVERLRAIFVGGDWTKLGTLRVFDTRAFYKAEEVIPIGIFILLVILCSRAASTQVCPAQTSGHGGELQQKVSRRIFLLIETIAFCSSALAHRSHESMQGFYPHVVLQLPQHIPRYKL